jgi:hypothetical protein
VLISNPASGDLRHVLLTINSLLSNYSGKLTVIINDLKTPIFCRNVVILLILGAISDRALAADIALHFWYSLLMPAEYQRRLSAVITSFLASAKDKGFDSPVSLGPRSTLSLWVFPGNLECFEHFISQSISEDDAQGEHDRVRGASSREDFRERMYSALRPSHRLSFKKYRQFGIVLPFGASNAHFNAPNCSLFSFRGGWLQTDFADPLSGWE